MADVVVKAAVVAPGGHLLAMLFWASAAVAWAGGLYLLALSDVRRMKAPTTLVRLTAGASGTLLVAGCLAGRNWHLVCAGSACGLVVGLSLACWSLLRPGQLGFADVRVGALVAFGAGATWPAACLASVPLACLAAGLVGKAREIAARCGTARSDARGQLAVPLVPFLVVGGIVVVVAGAS
ncbi:MAG: hypothetical protein ACP5VR_01540 [Acidimicrobiales bacterium]